MKSLAILFSVFSIFLSAQQARASGTETYIGIGITVSASHHSFQIIELIPGAPAERAGVMAGDWITAIDGKPTDPLKLEDVVKLISGGEPGTEVKLTLREDKTQNSREIVITRAQVTIECVLKGNVNLSLFGDPENGSIHGFVGQDSVYLNISFGRITGRLDHELVNLNVVRRGGNSFGITGWIRSSYINWQGNGTFISGYQACIY